MTYPVPSPNISVPSTKSKRRLREREWPRPPRRDPHSRLISQLLEQSGPDSSVIATSSRPWASATFVGARHVVVLKLGGSDHATRADRLAATIGEMEFQITGHIVADACVDERQLRMTGGEGRPLADNATVTTETVLRISLLTIEEW